MRRSLLAGALGLATALFVGVSTVPATAAGDRSADRQVTGEQAHAKVDLNRASAADLAKVEGIDQATADAIVRYRETNGPFASLDELLQVEGMTQEKLQALSGRITVEGGPMEQPERK